MTTAGVGPWYSDDPIFRLNQAIQKLQFGPDRRDSEAKPARFRWKASVSLKQQEQPLGVPQCSGEVAIPAGSNQ